MEGDGGHLVKLDEGGGEDVLSGVLLHVIAAAGGVDHAMNGRTGRWRLQRSFQIMNYPSVFCVGDFGDADAGVAESDPAGVVDLSAAGGVEGGFAKDDGRAVAGRNFIHDGIEF